jgi:hypothetical protein
MVEELKFGISINNHSLLEQDTTINLGISRAQENPKTCRFGALTQDGGNFSNILNLPAHSPTSNRMI